MSEHLHRAVAFDLDGTLIDSRRDLATAVNLTRSDLGLETLTVEAILGMVGEGARHLMRRALGGAPAPELLDRALERFYDHYDGVCTDRTRPFAGIDPLLRDLAVRMPVSLLTNKPERFARKIIDHLDWGGLFRTILGGDSLPTRKPDPQGLIHVARLSEVPADALLLVGDSKIDAGAADAAGCSLVLVEWGYADARERAELSDREWIVDAAALHRRLV